MSTVRRRPRLLTRSEMAARDFPPDYGFLDGVLPLVVSGNHGIPSRADLVHIVQEGITEPHEPDEYGLTLCNRLIHAYLCNVNQDRFCRVCVDRARWREVGITATPTVYDGQVAVVEWPNIDAVLNRQPGRDIAEDEIASRLTLVQS